MLRSKFSAVLIALAAILALGAGSSAFAGTVTGTVTGADGKPAAGVSVRLLKTGGEGARDDAVAKPAKPAKEKLAKGDKPAAGDKPKRAAGNRQAVQTATTSADGTFKFENVADGEYTVVAGGKGAGAGRTTAAVSGAEPVKVSITLKERKAKA